MTPITFERPIVVHAILFSACISFLFVALITILAELIAPGGVKILKIWLADTHGHHWVGKGIWTVITFVVVGFISYMHIKVRECPLKHTMLYIASYTAIFASLLIVLFYIYEYVVLH